jgi:hypothetical protein
MSIALSLQGSRLNFVDAPVSKFVSGIHPLQNLVDHCFRFRPAGVHFRVQQGGSTALILTALSLFSKAMALVRESRAHLEAQ